MNFNIRLLCSYNRRIMIATYWLPFCTPNIIKATNAKVKTMREILTQIALSLPFKLSLQLVQLVFRELLLDNRGIGPKLYLHSTCKYMYWEQI